MTCTPTCWMTPEQEDAYDELRRLEDAREDAANLAEEQRVDDLLFDGWRVMFIDQWSAELVLLDQDQDDDEREPVSVESWAVEGYVAQHGRDIERSDVIHPDAAPSVRDALDAVWPKECVCYDDHFGTVRYGCAVHGR